MKEILVQGIYVSERTLQRRLAETKLKAMKPARMRKLMPVMIEKRLEQAKKYKNWTIEDNGMLFILIHNLLSHKINVKKIKYNYSF